MKKKMRLRLPEHPVVFDGIKLGTVQKKMQLDDATNTSVHRGEHQFIAVNPKLELRWCTNIFLRRDL